MFTRHNDQSSPLVSS